jgi:putative membrane protein insertion efficiency factor
VSRVFAFPITLYRRFISPLMAPRCRYHPTCSAYAVEAIRSYGVLRGLVLAAWRLLRCNPLSNGGFDYVEQQTLFRAPAGSRASHTPGHSH